MRSEDIIIYDERKQIVLKTHEKKESYSTSDNSITSRKLAVGLVLLFTESILPIFKHMNALKNETRIVWKNLWYTNEHIILFIS
jgi:hypothetical protein